jgi:uracil-DNA glycosylase family 4
MKGFFTKQETQSVSRPNGKMFSCASCGLYRFVLTPRMKPFGNFKKRILNIGEAPGETEDEKGKQWQGKVGRRLQREYRRLGIDLFEDCLNINSINCRPTNEKGGNREPTPNEVACCRGRVLKVIEEYQPHVIVLLGNSAVSSLLGHRWKKDLGGIMKWRGWTIPDRDFKAWVCPVFRPSYVEREESGAVDMIWQKDLARAISMIKVPFPAFEDESRYVEIIEAKDFIKPYERLTELAAFDFETTGLKPHSEGHRIVCASVCSDEKHCQTFTMPGKLSERRPFLDFLCNPNIRKMAHNMKFEAAWAKVRLFQEVQGWYWDSMIAAHILSNRPGITGLKFQTYINFGVISYDEEVAPYLHSNGSKSGNAFNKVLEMIKDPVKKEKLLIYCGLDSIYEFKLAMKQQEAIYGNPSTHS